MSLITRVYVDEIVSRSRVFPLTGVEPELNSDETGMFASNGTIPGTVNGNLYYGTTGAFTDISAGGGPGPGPAPGPSYETLSALIGGDPSPNVEITDIFLNNGTSTIATLADPVPATLGLKKKLLISQYTVGSSLTLNITSFVHGNGLIFNALGSSASLIWSNSGWIIDVSGADVF